MTKDIRFYCRDGRWYADLPEYLLLGGTEEECEMIAGADEWLEFLAKGKDSIVVKISDVEQFNSILSKLDEDNEGATYVTATSHIVRTIWLCNVTKLVFGNFPHLIYYKKI